MATGSPIGVGSGSVRCLVRRETRVLTVVFRLLGSLSFVQ
jgi:hypothetical protein